MSLSYLVMLAVLVSGFIAAPVQAKCPDPSCEELSSTGSADPASDCPCPGPGCPNGGWKADVLGNAHVARCYEKAQKERDQRVKICARLGYCRVPVMLEPPALMSDAKCPCPGPGCPHGGWKEMSWKDEEVIACYRKAQKLNPPTLNDSECPCPGEGCPANGWEANIRDQRVRACRDKSIRQLKRMEDRLKMEYRLEKARAAIKIQ